MLTDPNFYLVAIPAVFLAGLSKGGLGGALAMLSVPLMSLVISPIQAAAIMLPILVIMDLAGLWFWRGLFDAKTVAIILPAAMVGIGIGWATAAWVEPDGIRLFVGIIAILFVTSHWLGEGERAAAKPHNPPKGLFWGCIAGFTSFVSHTGGPPYQYYVVPLRLDPKTYVGTSILIFMVINLAKVGPYFAIGQFDATNLKTSAVLIPLALISTLIGTRIVRLINPAVFYRVLYGLVFIIGLKLIYDGLTGLASG